MPAVPNLPGVPNLSSYAVNATVSLLVQDAISIISSLFASQWGIFLNGFPVVLADNVVSFGFKQNWRISDYPVENGGFLSYDKVSTPYEAKVRFSTGGSVASRQAFLDSIAAISGSLQLFDIVTPEEIYLDANIVNYDYERTATDGVGLISVDVNLVEIRVTATQAFTNTKSPTGQNAQSGGKVQPTAPPVNLPAAPLLSG